MRFIVYMLLLANLGLFAWLYTHSEQYRPAEPRAAAFPASVEPLILLRERPRAEPAAPALPEVSAPAQLPNEVEALQMSPDPDANPRVGPAAPENAAAETAPVPEAERAPVGEAPAAELPPPPVPTRLCQVIGPFSARDQVDALLSELTALGKTATVRAAQTEEPSGYWVYLPAMPRADARRTINELAAKGVKDYYLGRQNFISLGIFSDERSAENRLQEMIALGYQPRMEQYFVTREVYWVDLEELGPDHLSDAQWRDLLNAQLEPRRQPVTCE
ncbi:MAG: SPOR domain-containing protein [Chromatocurvus sp.]